MCDPAIKLFGKTIALPSHTDQAGAGRGGGGGVKGCTNNEEINTESKPNSEDKCDEPITSSITTTSSTADRETQLQKPPPSAAAAAADADDDDHDDHHHHGDHHHHQEEEKDPKTDQEEEEEQQQDEKPALKKPDKILPCPRCNSMDTKFCYYNNYNVNQPRHFCKNCQRYWTAGGTMRNVPVGAGRRKNKNAVAAAAAAHYRHLMTMTDAGPALKPKGTVLSFGSDMPLSESMASVLDLAEKSMKKKKTCNRSSGFQRMQEHVEEQSTGSSATNSNSAADDEGNNGANLPEPAGFRNCQGLPPHLLYIGSCSPWPYPWNPPPPTPPTSAPFCGSTFPIPIYPAAAYWGGCSAWSMPWLAPLQGSPSPTTTPPGCGPPNSPTTTTMLGKHTREGNVLHRGSSADTSVANEQSSQEKCLWIPKTLRIDDPEEAAKSSIWATMGFSKKNDKADGFSSLGGGLFRSFQTKTELWSRRVDASQALHANPAALSRSIEFQESS